MFARSPSKRAHTQVLSTSNSKRAKFEQMDQTLKGLQQDTAVHKRNSSERLNSTLANQPVTAASNSVDSTIQKQTFSRTASMSYFVEIPQEIISCREELEKQIKHNLEDVKRRNEILRGLDALTSGNKVKGVKLGRRTSKKRRLRLTKLKQVRKGCEDLLKEYYVKMEELNQRIFDFAKEAGARTIDDLTPEEGGTDTDEDTDELEPSPAEASDEFESTSLEGSDELYSSEDSIEEVHRARDKEEDEIELEYENKIRDYLQQQLSLEFDLKDEDVRGTELGDVIFYYLMRSEKLFPHCQKIIYCIYDPLCDHTIAMKNYSVYEMCCVILNDEKTFAQFCKRFGDDKTTFKLLLYKQPQLLLSEWSAYLMDRLIEYLPYSDLHQTILNIRYKNRQTCMFYVGSWYSSYVKLYHNHVDDLYALLSILNNHGQTALHVNTLWITYLLADTYTPKHRDTLIKLTSITDNNNTTALEAADVQNHGFLSSLIGQVKNNNYLIDASLNTNVLVIYNTRNRPGAEKEAYTICAACEDAFDESEIVLEKNKNEDDILQLLRQSASKKNIHGQPFTSFIVILTSHGNVGTIDDYDGKPMKLSDIEQAMCSDILEGRPKMLITQCCQLGQESSRKPPYAPTHEHFCAVMSCVSGQGSERGIFLTKLSKYIKSHKREANIFKLVQRVSAEMEREEHSQTPIIMSTLKAGFCPTGVLLWPDGW